MDKTISRDFIDQAGSLGGPPGPAHRAEAVFHFVCVRTERAEIVRTGASPGNGLHQRNVQGRGDIPAKAAANCGGFARDEVPVAPEAGIKAGVELGRDLVHGVHTDIPRKETVQRGKQLSCGNRGRGTKTSDLTAGVDAGIGSSRPDEGHILLKNFLQDPDHLILYGTAVDLALPSDEVGAVVFDDQFESAQGRRL